MRFKHKTFGHSFTIKAPETRAEWVAHREFLRLKREAKEVRQKQLMCFWPERPMQYHHGDPVL
jgi:hypothetical protein